MQSFLSAFIKVMCWTEKLSAEALRGGRYRQSFLTAQCTRGVWSIGRHCLTSDYSGMCCHCLNYPVTGESQVHYIAREHYQYSNSQVV